ncbi:MAG: sodium:solute symporter family protein [Candidatus Cybelea sp.]
MIFHPSLALVIAGTVVLGTIAFALLGVRHVKMDPAQYIVAGRSFGTLFLWVLLAGEIYTTFTFLGVAGLAYSSGAPAFYAMAFGGCAYVIGYFLAPLIWKVGKEHDLLTGPDFFETRYNSRALGVGCALLYFVMVVPYVALQLSGLQILLRIAGYGAYDATLSVCIGFLVLALFVFSAGLRGTAWASVVKDVFVLGAVLFAGIAIPMRFFGSPAAMFDRVALVHPQMLVVPLGGVPHGIVWFVSSIMLSAIGFFMGPHSFSAIFSARSGDTLRRNAVLLPFYQTFLALMLLSGFTASLVTPGLKGTEVDQSFLLVVQHFYPGWILGLVTAAGALAALVPASALLLAGASVITKNVAGDAFNLATSDASRTLLTRVLVIVVALLALAVWLVAQKTVVELLLLYYNGVAQFAPGAIATFAWPRRATSWGVAAGIIVGLCIAMPLALLNIAPWGINVGLLGLGANVITLIAISLALRSTVTA